MLLDIFKCKYCQYTIVINKELYLENIILILWYFTIINYNNIEDKNKKNTKLRILFVCYQVIYICYRIKSRKIMFKEIECSDGKAEESSL